MRLLQTLFICIASFAGITAQGELQLELSTNQPSSQVGTGITFQYEIEYFISGNGYTNIKILDNIPDDLEVLSTTFTPGVWQETSQTGNDLIFEYIGPADNIPSGEIIIEVQFHPGITCDAAVALNTATIIANDSNGGLVNVPSNQEATEADAIDRWTFNKLHDIGNALDNSVIYELRVEKSSQYKNYNIENVSITDIFPPNAELQSVHLGNSLLTNGVNYTVSGNEITVNVPNRNYNSSTLRYYVTLVYPSAQFNVGDEVINSAELQYTTACQEVKIISDQESLILAGNSSSGITTKIVDESGWYEDDFVPGCKAYYKVVFQNTGNVPLGQTILVDNLPVDKPIEIYSISATTTDGNTANLTFSYDNSIGNNQSLPGTFTGSYYQANLSTVLVLANTSLDMTTLKVNSPSLDLGGAIILYINFTILDTDVHGNPITINTSPISNCAEVTLPNGVVEESCATFAIEDLEFNAIYDAKVQRPNGSFSFSSYGVEPDNKIKCRFQIRSHGTLPILDGNIISTLDDRLEYCGNEKYYLGSSSNPSSSSFSTSYPPAVGYLTNNHSGNSLNWNFGTVPGICDEVNNFIIEFDVLVKSFSSTEDNNFILLSYDVTSNSSPSIASHTAYIGIISFSDTYPEKFVKNQLDVSFAPAIQSNAGEVVDYELRMTNIGNTILKNITIIDYLPFDGDTEILTNNSRGSEFKVNLTSSGVIPPSGFTGTIEYSTEASPELRADFNFTPSGPGTNSPNWSNIPANSSDVRSFKITYDPSYEIAPGETEVFTFKAVVPLDISANKKAFNSFAYRVSDLDDDYLFPNESQYACITTNPNPGCCIGNYVWDDTNANGQNEASEQGLNDITINLYDANGAFITSTLSTNNSNGDPGFYSFCGLEEGAYQIGIELLDGYFHSQANQGTDDQDSDIDPVTMLTEVITVNSMNCTIDNVDIGMSTTPPPPPSDPYLCEVCDSLCATAVDSTIVMNGDFSNGVSNYSMTIFPALTNCDNASYQVVSNPAELCTSFPNNIFDHSVGNATGSFLAIDGYTSSSGGQLMSFQVNVENGKEYNLSYWLVNFSTNWQEIHTELFISGVSLGELDMEGITTGVWTRHCVSYTATTTGQITIEIQQIGGTGVGYDFGLDDICMIEVEPTELYVDIGDNIYGCYTNSGKIRLLNSSVQGGGGQYSYQWSSPTISIVNPTSAQAQVSLDPIGYHEIILQVDEIDCGLVGYDTIYLEVIDCNIQCSCNESCYSSTTNLITNDHFEFGNSDFTSDLTLSGGNTCAYGFYMLGNEPVDLCTNFPSAVYDHTFGTSNGEFLLIDGHPLTSRVVYRTTVGITPFSQYDFGMWYLEFLNSNEPEFELSINGIVVTTGITTTDATAGSWMKYCFSFNSDTLNGFYDLELRQINSGGSGYDYGLDDLCLSKVSSDLYLTATDTIIQVCPSADFTLEVTAIGADGPIASYDWTPIDHLISSTNNQATFNFTEDGVHYVNVVATDQSDCTAEFTFRIEVQDCAPVSNCPDLSCVMESNSSLIQNGNFENGYLGFSSDLPISMSNCSVGSYSVQNTPNQHCTSFSSVAYDHTLGTQFGHMLIIDGSSTTVLDVLKYDVYLIEGDFYNLSFNMMNLTTSGSYGFDIFADEVLIGSISDISNTILQWEEFCFSWEAAGTGTKTITIRQTNPLGSGRDYAIDDVSIKRVNNAVSVETIEDISICLGNAITLNTDVEAIHENYICSWTGSNDLNNSSLCEPTFIASEVGVYNLVLLVNLGDSCFVQDDVTITVVDCNAGCYCDNGELPISELVFNGNFEVGILGINSDLPIDCSCNSGSFCVTSNARAKCTVSGWSDIYPSAGAGNYMVVDGANGNIWSQDVSIVSGSSYTYKFDLYPNISGAASPTLRLKVNGVTVLDNISGTGDIWNTISTNYVATTTGTVSIAIDQTSANGYSDYGIDNICFSTCSEGDVCENNRLENGEINPGSNFGQYSWGEYAIFWTAIRKYSGNSEKTAYVEVEDGCTNNNSIELTGNAGAGNGVWQKINLNSSSTYDLSFCAKWLDYTLPNARVRFRAVTDPALISKYVGYADCNLPECEEIFLSQDLTNNWTSYISPGYTPSGDFSALIITPENNQANPKVQFMSSVRIDNICLEQTVETPCNPYALAFNYDIDCATPGDEVLVTWNASCKDSIIGRLILIDDIANQSITTVYDIFNHGSYLYKLPDNLPDGTYRFYMEYDAQTLVRNGSNFQISSCCQSCPDQYDINLNEGGIYTLTEYDIGEMRSNSCHDSYSFSDSVFTCIDIGSQTITLTTTKDGITTMCDIIINVSDENGKCCPDMIMYEAYLSNDGCYNADQIIASKGIIMPGNNIQYISGKAVKLEPGFEAKKGTVFKTELEGCQE